MPATQTHQLRIVRTFNATPEDVFNAWTDPVAIKAFWKPGPGFTIPNIAIDLRVGGAYRVEMLGPDGTTHVAMGIYKEIVVGKKLVYTWNPAQACDGNSGSDVPAETLVTMEFRAKGSGTELTFIHDQFLSDASRRDHERGWTGILTSLEAHFK